MLKFQTLYIDVDDITEPPLFPHLFLAYKEFPEASTSSFVFNVVPKCVPLLSANGSVVLTDSQCEGWQQRSCKLESYVVTLRISITFCIPS